jgi:predicted HTH domain antitoxin
VEEYEYLQSNKKTTNQKNMSVLTVQIPDSLKMNDFELKMMIASKLFEDGKLSSGQAAEIVGISKRSFVELLGKYNVSLFGYDYEELEEDLENA